MQRQSFARSETRRAVVWHATPLERGTTMGCRRGAHAPREPFGRACIGEPSLAVHGHGHAALFAASFRLMLF